MPAQTDVNGLLDALQGEVREVMVTTDGHGRCRTINLEYADGRAVVVRVGDGSVTKNGHETIIALRPPSV